MSIFQGLNQQNQGLNLQNQGLQKQNQGSSLFPQLNQENKPQTSFCVLPNQKPLIVNTTQQQQPPTLDCMYRHPQPTQSTIFPLCQQVQPSINNNQNSLFDQSSQSQLQKIQELSNKLQILEKKLELQTNQEQRIQQLESTVSILSNLCAVNFKGLCNNGHLLDFYNFSEQFSNAFCDVCKGNLKDKQVGTYRCKLCDFDRCEQCFSQCKLL